MPRCRISYWFLILALLIGSSARSQSLNLIENKGQWPEHVKGGVSIPSGQLFFQDHGIRYHVWDTKSIRTAHETGASQLPNDARIRGHVYEMTWLGSHAPEEPVWSEEQATTYNYYLGNQPEHWAADCKSYKQCLLPNLYPEIDLKIYSQFAFMKYDFVVHPGGDPRHIQMRYAGAEDVRVENGKIVIRTSTTEIWEQPPLSWQIIQGEKRAVSCAYILLDKNTIGFTFGEYDVNTDLIIDPELVFSTYSGSTSDNFGYTATYDEAGNLYSGSSAFGQGYPTTLGAYQTMHQGGDSVIEQGIDMALSKYDASGTFMVWSTFLGGVGDDLPLSIITNTNDELFVYGTTGSPDFPVTPGAFDIGYGGGTAASPSGTGANFPNGTDIVVAHFNADCTSLIGSTYVGGTGNDGINQGVGLNRNYADEFRGEISLDQDGDVLVISSTRSVDFPTLNPIQANLGGGQDAVAFKMNSALTNMIWGTYLGGAADDSGFSITNNASGEHYLTGGTASSDFPMVAGGIQPVFGGGIADGYVVRLGNNGNTLLSSTFYGSDQYDQFYFIEVDNENQVYLFGQTNAAGSSMIINAGYGVPNSGNLLTKMTPDLSSITWSTVIGTGDGKPNLSPSAFLVDYCNRVYLSGWGIIQVAGNALNPNQNLHTMSGLPTTSDAFDNACSTGDFYMAIFDENMQNLEYATFFGGGSSSEHVDGGTSRFDRKGVIYQSVCAGCGGYDDFPIAPSNAWSALNNSSCNNGVYKFDFQLPLTVADFSNSPELCAGNAIQFIQESAYASTFHWDFGDGQTSALPSPQHVYQQGGTYTVTLVVENATTCNGIDSLQQTLVIGDQGTSEQGAVNICLGSQIQIGPSTTSPNATYSWSPADGLVSPNNPVTTFNGNSSQVYTLAITENGCVQYWVQPVDVVDVSIEAPADTTLCDAAIATLMATGFLPGTDITWSLSPDGSNPLNTGGTDFDIEVQPNLPTTYYVIGSIGNCTDTASVHVDLVSFQTSINGDFTVCSGDELALSVSNPNPNFVYTWSPAEPILSGQGESSILVTVDTTTLFYVSSLSPEGCIAQDSALVFASNVNTLMLNATADPEVILSGQGSQLNAGISGYTYLWTPASQLSNAQSASPMAYPQETTTYTVILSEGECSSMDTVTVRVVDFVCGPPIIYVPNAFTPNGDNDNDRLFVRANLVTDVYFAVYDRWGERVFETTNLQVGWNGEFEGEALDPDVYVYYLKATCEGGQTYYTQGNVTLIR